MMGDRKKHIDAYIYIYTYMYICRQTCQHLLRSGSVASAAIPEKVLVWEQCVDKLASQRRTAKLCVCCFVLVVVFVVSFVVVLQLYIYIYI